MLLLSPWPQPLLRQISRQFFSPCCHENVEGNRQVPVLRFPGSRLLYAGIHQVGHSQALHNTLPSLWWAFRSPVAAGLFPPTAESSPPATHWENLPRPRAFANAFASHGAGSAPWQAYLPAAAQASPSATRKGIADSDIDDKPRYLSVRNPSFSRCLWWSCYSPQKNWKNRLR